MTQARRLAAVVAVVGRIALTAPGAGAGRVPAADTIDVTVIGAAQPGVHR